METIKNYKKLKGLALLTEQFMYVDVYENGKYLGDNILAKNRVSIRFTGDYCKNGTDYRLIFCRVRKKDVSKFLESMKELENKIALLGHTDYMDFCNFLKHSGIM